MNTQRVLIFAIMVNLVLGMISSLASNDNNNALQKLTGFSDKVDDKRTHWYDNEHLQGTIFQKVGQIYENSIGNMVNMGKILIDIFFIDINKFHDDNYENQAERVIGKGLETFRALLTIIIMLEAYFIFKNRKTR